MQRLQQLSEWLQSHFPTSRFELSPASADASFRRYFRARFSDKTLIVMDAPPQYEDCRPFLHVARILENAGVQVPQVLAHDVEQGFMLLTDLGNTTYLQALSTRNINTANELYNAATDALLKIQLSSCLNELPVYDETLLRREINLFPDWYIARHKKLTLNDKQCAQLGTVFDRLIKNNLAQPQVYVHRDFHSRNLMVIESSQDTETFPEKPFYPLLKGKRLASPGILDFQDAVYGPITYDLVSLFKDAYIHWEEAQIMDWLIRYWEKARSSGLPVNSDFGEFYRDYEWMGVQRHLKVLGIFARLGYRDGKVNYLNDMPLVMDYLRRASARYIDLKPLLNVLDEIEQNQPQTGFTF